MEDKVYINIERYDDLLHKEKQLEILIAGLSKLSGYTNVEEFKKFLGLSEIEVQ